ncbi:hypothetical protein GOB57_09550 [Sinorhizobium meliloti]|nr:hypothetical protein [Sinorhizobium meliloti]
MFADQLGRRLLLTMLVISSLVSPADAEETIQQKFVEPTRSVLLEIYKFKANPTRLIAFLDGLKSRLNDQAAPMNSLLDMKDIEEVGRQISELDKLTPNELKPLNNASAIAEVAGPVEGDLIGGAIQLDRLQKVEAKRGTQIEELRRARDQLMALSQEHENAYDLAREISKGIEPFVDDPAFTITALVSGNNIALSWLDLETDLLPALNARADASKAAAARFAAAVELAETDLRGFQEARQFAHVLWAEPLNNTPETIDLLRQRMTKETQATMARANELRREANAIRSHNAGIDSVNRLLQIGGAAWLAGSGASRTDQLETPTTPNSLLLNRRETPLQPPR